MGIVRAFGAWDDNGNGSSLVMYDGNGVEGFLTWLIRAAVFFH